MLNRGQSRFYIDREECRGEIGEDVLVKVDATVGEFAEGSLLLELCLTFLSASRFF